ncbi:MAG: O-antigen ligase family protein [Bryobacteraceae bacterium]
MNSAQHSLERASFYLACGSAAAVLISIAACHILLTLSVATLLISGQKLRFPPVKIPLALFAFGTLLSMFLSAEPALGRPQIRKFFVFLTLLVICSAVRNVKQFRALMLVWGGVAALAALRGIVQFFSKRQEVLALGEDFYYSYMADRITGFMGHWMTFSGEQMIALLMLSSILFFSPLRRWGTLAWLALGLIFVSIVLGMTRGIWLATAVGSLYLLWHWRPKLIWFVPVAVAAGLWIAPRSITQRLISVYQPHGMVDSNEHRRITWITGWEMIKAHPIFGVGPEHVGVLFRKFVPADIPQPLPAGWYGHLHSIYLHYAAERGIPTLLALLWMLGRFFHDFSKGLRKTPPEAVHRKAILRGAIAVMLAVLVEGFFELNLGDSEILTMFLVVIGGGYVTLWAEEPEHA